MVQYAAQFDCIFDRNEREIDDLSIVHHMLVLQGTEYLIVPWKNDIFARHFVPRGTPSSANGSPFDNRNRRLLQRRLRLT